MKVGENVRHFTFVSESKLKAHQRTPPIATRAASPRAALEATSSDLPGRSSKEPIATLQVGRRGKFEKRYALWFTLQLRATCAGRGHVESLQENQVRRGLPRTETVTTRKH